MTCQLPTPIWKNPARAGLQSSRENTSTSTYDLSWGRASPGTAGEQVYYNIFWGQDVFTLFDIPRAFSTALSAQIPKVLTGNMPLFGVRAAEGGVTADFGTANLPLEFDTGTSLYPVQTHTRFFYENDGYLPVTSVSGFPLQDGYIRIGEEIIFYSDLLDGYDGYGAFLVADRNPYGCNDAYHYEAGAPLELFRGFEEQNGANFMPIETCVPPRPIWAEESRPGIASASDPGLGQFMQLEWGPATAPPGHTLYFNVYWSQTLISLFDHPRGITDAQSVLVPDLAPTDGYYFGARATYFTEPLDLGDFNQLSGQLFGYPDSTVVSTQYLSTDSSPLAVNSTSGFPSAGYLEVGAEILQYSAKAPSSFTISRRDVFDFGQQATHVAGAEVRFWSGLEDDNVQFYHNVASWDRGEVTARMPVPADGPAYLQDSDGYRSQPLDNLTEDHSNFEQTNEDFPQYPYCGYRVTDWVALYTRQVCGTYFGGRQDGLGGISIGTVNLQRQEMLLGVTGEPFTLLRRKWTGRYCPKISHRHEHPYARCGQCYGTNFDGGYDRYINSRQIRPAVDNPNGLIMARVTPYKNDLDRSPERGLTQIDTLTAWTLPIPQLRDSDVLIKYIFDPITLDIIEEEFRWQVLDVTRNTIITGQDGVQQFTLRKLDKTDIVYSFPATII